MRTLYFVLTATGFCMLLVAPRAKAAGPAAHLQAPDMGDWPLGDGGEGEGEGDSDADEGGDEGDSDDTDEHVYGSDDDDFEPDEPWLAPMAAAGRAPVVAPGALA